MATSRVPNRYIRLADLIALLNRLFDQTAYTVQEHPDAYIVSGISRELTNMDAQHYISYLQKRIIEIRIENVDGRYFVPEKEYLELLSKDLVKKIISGRVSCAHTEEVVGFISNDARKVFGILVLIGASTHLNCFIQKDQLQTRPIDNLLPFAKDILLEILNDVYVCDLFFTQQWEFCAPVFSGNLIPRSLDSNTVLPFLEDKPINRGVSGAVSKIKIHPSHQPQSFGSSALFVRKEYFIADTTYNNEIHILSTLQLLRNPNILPLIGCYTYKSKHNLITPYISGGNLEQLLKKPNNGQWPHERSLYALTGLACGLRALHELKFDTNVPSLKGQHQDFRHANILVESDSFIISDFGLSSIKEINKSSLTLFKNCPGYCQAPECVNLGYPFKENNTTRATDIFALGCIAADMIIYTIKGAAGVSEFYNAREFVIPPMCYYKFHKEDASNPQVGQWLQDIAAKSGYKSIADAVHLVSEMLAIDPGMRPSMSTVMGTLCISTIKAYSEHLSVLFSDFTSFSDAAVEEARFLSWLHCQDLELYSDSLGATQTGTNFDATINLLRQYKTTMENFRNVDLRSRERPFLELSIFNIRLLNGLSPKRRADASAWFDSILLEKLPSKSKCGQTSSYIESATVYSSRIKNLATIREIITKVEDASTQPLKPINIVPSKFISYTKLSEHYKLATISEKHLGRSQPVFIEIVSYPDRYRQQQLLKRMSALYHLFSDSESLPQLRALRLIGICNKENDFCFELLYRFPHSSTDDFSSIQPISLHGLLVRKGINKPSWESRVQLSLELAEAVAAFHDVKWYHKDLTSSSVFFFPYQAANAASQIRNPYLVNFQHSRSASDERSEGPVQDPNYQRYHHPQYIHARDHYFERFQSRFDWYSLGILLIEIGLWSTIDEIMSQYRAADNWTFSRSLREHAIPLLSFQVGSFYASVVRECLKDIQNESDANLHTKYLSPVNLLVKERIISPLREYIAPHVAKTGRKRKRGRE